MGQNKERLDRLKANRGNIIAVAVRTAQAGQRAAVVTVVDTASAGVTKAARTEGFEGELGTAIQERLKAIHVKLEEFGEYQAKLGAAINAANQALQETATGADGLPTGEMSAGQKSTVEMAAKTGSPVQVSPGVTLTPEQATKWYQDQAEAEQEEAARKLNAALDKRLQEIIDGMPTSKYDPEKPSEEPEGDGGSDGPPTVGGPGIGGGSPGVTGPGGGSGGGGGYDGPGVTGPRDTDGGRNDPPRVVDPDFPGPRHPEVYPPVRPNPTDPETPNIDGGIDGVVPGTPPGGGLTPPGGGLTPPGGGLTGPGGGVTAPGGVGLVGGAGLAAGAGRVGAGMGGIGGAGRVGGVGGIGGMGGTGAGGSGVGAAGVVQGGAAGGRGGVMAGGMAGGAAGAGGKKNRRRGQDLLAYEIDDEDEGVTPDLGEAGAAGRSASDGREETGW